MSNASPRTFVRENLRLLYSGFEKAFDIAARVTTDKKTLMVHDLDLETLHGCVYNYIESCVRKNSAVSKDWRESIDYELQEALDASSGDLVNYCNLVQEFCDFAFDDKKWLKFKLNTHLSQADFEALEQSIIGSVQSEVDKLQVCMVQGAPKQLAYLPADFYPEI